MERYQKIIDLVFKKYYDEINTLLPNKTYANEIQNRLQYASNRGDLISRKINDMLAKEFTESQLKKDNLQIRQSIINSYNEFVTYFRRA